MAHRSSVIILYQTGKKIGTAIEAVRCASRFVPLKDITLIGDNEYIRTGRFFNIRTINTSIVDMSYVHLTKNSESFEKECIRRWFAIMHVMKRLNVDRAFCMDSDVLLCCNPFLEAQCLDCDVSLSSVCGLDDPVDVLCPAASMQSRKSIESFCASVPDFFRLGLQVNYGSSDMGIWTALLGLNKTIRFRQMNKIVNLSVFDHSLATGRELYAFGPEESMGRSHKMIHFQCGVPYAILKDGTPIRMLSVHMWAYLKDRMRGFNNMMEESLSWDGCSK